MSTSNHHPTAKNSVEVIFENEDIKVLWHAGNSDFLLITFGDLVTLAEGVSFFADTPVKKIGINCIGFMAKCPNWFPSESVLAAIKHVNYIKRNFSKSIIYGGSMGGYAAVKYSSCLDADFVVALCPQWSLDIEECNGTNPGYQSFFKSHMSGMSIKNTDISGSIFILYDPSYAEDSFHALQIKAIYPQAKTIHMRSTDHYVTSVLAGTNNLSEILDAVIRNDGFQLSIIANRIRRTHPRRLKILLSKLMERHPLLLEGVLENHKNLSSLNKDEVISINSKLLSHLVKNSENDRAARTATRLSVLDICPIRSKLLLRLAAILHSKKEKIIKLITTAHKKVLSYDLSTGTLSQFTAETSMVEQLDILPVSVSEINGKHFMSLTVDNETSFFMVSSNGSLALVSCFIASISPDRIIRAEMKDTSILLRFKIGDHYLTAEPSGSISYNRTEAKGWEEFKISYP